MAEIQHFSQVGLKMFFFPSMCIMNLKEETVKP